MFDWLGDDKRAIAMLRISSHRQKDNTSHDTQEKEIRDYCAAVGLTIVDVVRITESAKDSDLRVQYLKAIASALKRKIRHVVFNVFDRETRNLTDNEKNEKLVRLDKVVLHYARERKVLFKDSPDSDFFMRDISAVTNKQFIRNLSAKVSDAMRTKAEGGWFPGNWPPLGYVHKKLKDEQGRELKRGSIIVPNPNTKKVEQVQREFELRAAGHSLSIIRDKIISEGFIEPSKVENYHKSEIEKRLKNTFYSGRFTWHGVEYEGRHELIIPKEIRLKVQGVTYGKRATRAPTEYNLFGNGWMRCAECGCQIVYECKKKNILSTGATKEFHYYHCSNMRRMHPSLKGMNLAVDQIWQQLDKSVDSIAIPRNFAKEIAKALNGSHEKNNSDVKRQLQNYRDAIKASEVKENVIYDDYCAKILDEVGYHRQLKRVRDEREQFHALLSQAETAMNGNFIESAETILELATSAKSLWLSRSAFERKEFLEMIHSNRLVRGLNIEIYLKKPFEILAKMKVLDEWRPELDDLRTCLLLPNQHNSLISKGNIPV